jgi:hypothetical protein
MKHERNLLSVSGRRVATIVVIVLVLLGLALAAAVPTLAAPPASFPVIIRLVPDAAWRADLGGQGRTGIADLDTRLAQSPAVPIARRTWVRPESTPRPNGGNENGSLHRPFDIFDEGIAVIGQ